MWPCGLWRVCDSHSTAVCSVQWQAAVKLKDLFDYFVSQPYCQITKFSTKNSLNQKIPFAFLILCQQLFMLECFYMPISGSSIRLFSAKSVTQDHFYRINVTQDHEISYYIMQYHAIPWVPRIRRTRWQDGDKTWCRHSVVGIGGVSKLEIRIRCARLGHTCWPTNRCIGCCYIIRCTHCSSDQSQHLTTIVWVIFLFFAFVILIQYFVCCC